MLLLLFVLVRRFGDPAECVTRFNSAFLICSSIHDPREDAVACSQEARIIELR